MARVKIEGLKVNTQYKFYVVAVGPDDVESAPSGIYTFTTTGDTTAPDPISNLLKDFSTTTMTASWTGPDISTTPDFLDYKIVITNPSSTASQIFYTNNKTFDFPLELNRTLFGFNTPSPSVTVAISSRDTSGNISAASTTTVANPVPSSISSASADFSGRNLYIKWPAVSATSDNDVTGYQFRLFNTAAAKTMVYPIVGKDAVDFTLQFEQNSRDFGNIPRPTFSASLFATDVFGQLSATPYTATITNPAPTESPSINALAILRGFSASWNAVSSSFIDYSYTEVSYSSDPGFSSSTVLWTGNGTYMEYAAFGLYNPIYVRARHFDVFGQPSAYSNTGSITPVAPITVDTIAPTNATGITVTASNNGGATALSGYLTIRWTNDTLDSTLRGARLRIRAQGDSTYQYENISASYQTSGSYQVNSLIPGYVYEVAIASYDEINNTSSFTVASPSAILIPYGTTPTLSTSASGTVGTASIILASPISASQVGMIVAGWGILPGTIITASYASGASVQVSNTTASSFSGSAVSIYPGVADWRSYVTAGASMKFGTGVQGAQSGVWLDRNNYWYTNGNFKVGSNTSYFSWDGQTASISGDIRANSGSFLGNVNVASAGSIYAGSNPSSGARVIFNASGVIGYNSSNINTFVLDAISGNIGASAGNIGGWLITASTISSNNVGFYAPNSPATTDIAIFAGDTFANRANAPFRVTYGGNASFTNAYLSGSLVSTSGSIGSFYIGASGIYAASNPLSETSISSSIVSANIGASNTLINLADLMYLRSSGSGGKPQIYINSFKDTGNYSNINISAGDGDGALEMYRRQTVSTGTLTATSIIWNQTSGAASLFVSSNPRGAGLRAGTQILLTGLPSSASYWFTASGQASYRTTTGASFSATTASFDATASALTNYDFITSPQITGSAVYLTGLTAIPRYDSNSLYVDTIYVGNLNGGTATPLSATSALGVSAFSFIVSIPSASIKPFDVSIDSSSFSKTQVVSVTASTVKFGTVTNPARSIQPASAAFAGASAIYMQSYPNFADFNSTNQGTTGSVFYSIISVVEGATASYITFSKYAVNADGFYIPSGSQTGLSATITSYNQFSGKISTTPFYAQNGQMIYFSHDRGPVGASGGWPIRSDYSTGLTASRILEPNIQTRANTGTISMQGSWMTDGISQVILGDGYNNYGAELVSWYDTYVGSLISRIAMYGTYGRYSSFWTGSSVKSGRPGMSFTTSQGGYSTTASISASGTAGTNFIYIPSTASTLVQVGQEIINTTNTTASGVGSENQITAITYGSGGASTTLTMSYTLSAGFSGTTINLYTPDRRKMEFNSSGNIFMQSEEDITFGATRFLGPNNSYLSIQRNPSQVYMDAAKYVMGSGYFKSGIDIEPQTGWTNSASPYIMITPFDNFGTRITTNALSYNHFYQSWMAGNKQNIAGNGVRLRVESTGVGAGNAGVKIGRWDGTTGLSYVDFHTSGATVPNQDVRLLASGGTAGSTHTGSLQISAARVTLPSTGTPAAGTSDTQVATTAFVSNVMKFSGNATGTGSAGVSGAGYFEFLVSAGTSLNGVIVTSNTATAARTFTVAVNKRVNGATSPGWVQMYVENNASTPVASGTVVGIYYMAW